MSNLGARAPPRRVVGRMAGLSRIGLAQRSDKVSVSETVATELMTAFIMSVQICFVDNTVL